MCSSDLSEVSGSIVVDGYSGQSNQYIDHRVNLDWASLEGWGDGQVRVQIDTNLGTQTRTLSAADGMTGSTITWNETKRSEERRVGKECRSRLSPYH